MNGVLIQIAPDVPVVRLASALAQAGLAIRHDRLSNRLVIRAARPFAPELARLLNRLSVASAKS